MTVLLGCIYIIGASISKPHHRRSTVKSVFLLGWLVGWLFKSSLIIIWMKAVYISTNLNTLMVHHSSANHDTIYRESFAKENFCNRLIVSVCKKTLVNLVI